MPEWLIERGIGETRAALVEDGRIIEARVLRDGIVGPGSVLRARLKSVGRNSVAIVGDQEYLLPRGAPGVTQGSELNIEVTREALGGSEPWKRPLARMTQEEVRQARVPEGRAVDGREIDLAGWPDLVEEARSSIIQFPGGELRVCLTPAMTLVDVDGHLPPAELAVAGASAAAKAIRRHGVAGSIGIDLPTIEGKGGRQAAASAIDDVLPQPFERTAVNGFGFVQIVRPRAHASMFELAADRAAFEARALLRQAGREIGPIRLAAHPSVIAELEAHPELTKQLSRQVGGTITLRSDASLAMSAGYAERS